MFLLLYTQHPSFWTLSRAAANWGRSLLFWGTAVRSSHDSPTLKWKKLAARLGNPFISTPSSFLLPELCQKPSFPLDLKLLLTFLAPITQFSFKKSIISPLLLYRRPFMKRQSWKDPNSWYLSRRVIIVCNMGLKKLLDSSGFIKIWYREGQAKCNNPFQT